MKKQLDLIDSIIQEALDKDKETSVAYLKFKKAIKSTATLRVYNHALDRFMILCKFKSYDKTVKLGTDKVQELLEKYIISLENHSFQTANQRLAGIELW